MAEGNGAPMPQPQGSYIGPQPKQRRRRRWLLLPFSVAEELPLGVQYALAELPAEAQEVFMEEYRRRARSVGKACLAWLVACHYIYLRRWRLQILFWATWAGAGVWWIIDAFRIPRLVEEHNRNAAMNALRAVRLMGW